MIETLISGAQTGVDLGALRAAVACGIPIGGFVPSVRLNEDGPIPADLPMWPLEVGGYRERTRANVEHADFTLVLHTAATMNGGTAFTVDACLAAGKPFAAIDLDTSPPAGGETPPLSDAIASVLRDAAPSVLNVAGPRESKSPGIGERVRALLEAVFHVLGVGRPAVLPQHEWAVARGADCQSCPCYGQGRGPVPSQIVPGTVLAIGGEAPGDLEVAAGENFVGWSGEQLALALIMGGFPSRAYATIVNAAACMPEPPYSLDEFIARESRHAKRAGRPFKSPVECCYGRFARDLDDSRGPGGELPRVLLAVGKAALAAFERYVRERGLYDGDELVMARVHGAPIPLAAQGPDVPASTFASLPALVTADPPLTSASHSGSGGGLTPAGAGVMPTTLLPAPAGRWSGAPGAAGAWLFGSYHPAFAHPLREPKWMRYVQGNIARAARTAMTGRVAWEEPEYLLAPPAAVAVEWCNRAAAYGAEIVTDLETCDPITGRPSADQHTCAIRCVGLSLAVPQDGAGAAGVAEYVTVIPFRHMDGSPWGYSPADVTALVGAMRAMFDACPIATHNGLPFDSEILLRPVAETVAGLPTPEIIADAADLDQWASGGLLSVRARGLVDSLVLHHCTRGQDMPHSLSFVGREYLEVPAWKSKEDIASTDNADDGRLLLRCARDSLVTHRVLPLLRRDITTAGTAAQYETDQKVGLILRDMSELGLCLDEVERGRMSRILNSECARLLAKWHALSGKDVNPRSVPQMQQLLYGDWGLEPPLTTEGETVGVDGAGVTYDLDPDDVEPEDGSTSAAALIALIDRGLDPRQAAALEALLEYKALDKPRSTSCDDLPARHWPGPVDWTAAEEWLAPEGALTRRRRLSWIRATWSIGRTPVGRSVCKKPGLQQVPKLGRRINLAAVGLGADEDVIVNMRRMYVAAPGHVLVGADFAQSHIRIYAASAGDALLYDAVARGLDAHILNAAALLAASPNQVTPIYAWIKAQLKEEQEYWKLISKKVVFSFVYGAEPETTYAVAKKDRRKSDGQRTFPNLQLSDVQTWHGHWFENHPWTAPWQRNEIALYRARGYAEAPIGDFRRRYGPLEENQIPNHSILAFEGWEKNDALQIIAAAIPHRGWSEWSGPVFDGHDFLCVQVPESRGAEAARIVEDAMHHEWRGMHFVAKAKIAHSLGDL